jgi:hypothetical protein
LEKPELPRNSSQLGQIRQKPDQAVSNRFQLLNIDGDDDDTDDEETLASGIGVVEIAA